MSANLGIFAQVGRINSLALRARTALPLVQPAVQHARSALWVFTVMKARLLHPLALLAQAMFVCELGWEFYPPVYHPWVSLF